MSIESKTGAEVNGSEPFAEARGWNAPDEPCPLCEARGVRWVRPRPMTNWSYVVAETCCDCHGKGRRPVRPNSPAKPQ